MRTRTPLGWLRLASWLLSGWCCLGVANFARGQASNALPPPAPPPAFANPPLKYFGPDPTHQYFLPGLPAELVEEPYGPPPDAVWDPSQFEMWGPDDGADELLLTDELMAPPRRISEHKSGFFQKVSLTGTWLPGGDRSDYGVTEVDSFLTVAVPFPTRRIPLLITPAYNVRFLDGPEQPDLPARLQEAYVDFAWVPQIHDRLLAVLAVAPTVRNDFVADTEEAFSVTGKALVRYDLVPERLQVAAGVLYLDREDVRLLPVGGIIWKPTDAQNYELIFPRPKFSWRLLQGADYEEWLYVGGEFGGNSYLVERQPGITDHLTLFDIRTYVGLERKRDGGAGRRLEVGYVFAREAEFLSGSAGLKPDDTVMVRLGLTY